MPEASPNLQRPNWRLLAYIPLLWLALPSLIGFVIASAIGEHGSIVFLLAGLALGVAGAASHFLLYLLPWFRSARPLAQLLAIWSLATAGAMAYLATNWYLVSDSPAPSPQEFMVALTYVSAVLLPLTAILRWAVWRIRAA